MPAQVSADQAAMQRFSDAVRQLGKMSGKNFEAVIRHELGAILTSAVRNTKKATVKSIRENARRRPGMVLDSDEYQGPQSRTGKQYTPSQRQRLIDRAAKRRADSPLIYYLPGSRQPKRYPDWVWTQIQQKRERQLKERLGARGLAAKMWLHISDQLRLNVQAPAYIRKARNAKQGDLKEMVSTAQGGRGAEYSVGFVNSLTKTNPHARAGLAFRRALNARANYFRKSVQLAAKGVIGSVFERYPNLGRFS